MLACRPAEDLKQFAGNGLAQFGPITISSLSALEADLERIRETGIGFDNEESARHSLHRSARSQPGRGNCSYLHQREDEPDHRRYKEPPDFYVTDGSLANGKKIKVEWQVDLGADYSIVAHQNRYGVLGRLLLLAGHRVCLSNFFGR
jgi:hypothetical protein